MRPPQITTQTNQQPRERLTMSGRYIYSETLNEMGVSELRENCYEQRILFLLANSEVSLMPRSIKDRIGGTGSRSDTKIRDILLNMKRWGLVLNDTSTDHWSVTHKGIKVLTELGHPTRSVALPVRTPKAKRSEVYERPPYDGKELGPTVTRDGAYDAFKLPSRMNNQLYYRDGRVESV